MAAATAAWMSSVVAAGWRDGLSRSGGGGELAGQLSPHVIGGDCVIGDNVAPMTGFAQHDGRTVAKSPKAAVLGVHVEPTAQMGLWQTGSSLGRALSAGASRNLRTFPSRSSSVSRSMSRMIVLRCRSSLMRSRSSGIRPQFDVEVVQREGRSGRWWRQARFRGRRRCLGIQVPVAPDGLRRYEPVERSRARTFPSSSPLIGVGDVTPGDTTLPGPRSCSRCSALSETTERVRSMRPVTELAVGGEQAVRAGRERCPQPWISEGSPGSCSQKVRLKGAVEAT